MWSDRISTARGRKKKKKIRKPEERRKKDTRCCHWNARSKRIDRQFLWGRSSPDSLLPAPPTEESKPDYNKGLGVSWHGWPGEWK